MASTATLAPPKVSQDAGHWYTADGRPAYTYLNAKNEEKNTTLREARKWNLYPSVTTITKVIPAPALVSWIVEQHILAAATLPRVEGETGEQFIARVKADADAQRDAAAAFGTKAHTAIERTLRGETVEDPVFLAVATGCVAELDRTFPGVTWEEERSASRHFGEFAVGGRIDLSAADTSEPAIVDWKGKDGDVSAARCFDEHFAQAAAYSMLRYGHLAARTGNIFFSRTDHGQAKFVEHTQEQREYGWKLFIAAASLWGVTKGYTPAAPAAGSA